MWGPPGQITWVCYLTAALPEDALTVAADVGQQAWGTSCRPVLARPRQLLVKHCVLPWSLDPEHLVAGCSCLLGCTLPVRVRPAQQR